MHVKGNGRSLKKRGLRPKGKRERKDRKRGGKKGALNSTTRRWREGRGPQRGNRWFAQAGEMTGRKKNMRMHSLLRKKNSGKKRKKGVFVWEKKRPTLRGRGHPHRGKITRNKEKKKEKKKEGFT